MYKEALNILNILNDKGFDSYIVGGFVRDKLLGITNEESQKILDLTFDYYFSDKTPEFIQDVRFKASIIAYIYVLYLKVSFLDENNELQKQEIEFCKNYLSENVPKIDTLAF